MQMMTPEQLPGTVGAALATPGGVHPLKVTAWTAAFLAVVFAVVAALTWVSGGSIDVTMGQVLMFKTQYLVPYLGWIALAAVVCLVVYVALTLGAALLGANVDSDLKSEATHGTLRMMVEQPRFGVERQTPLPSVGLRVSGVPGTFGGVVKVSSKKYQFKDSDFTGARAQDFGGCDIMVESGSLYVIADERAKERWLKGRE